MVLFTDLRGRSKEICGVNKDVVLLRTCVVLIRAFVVLIRTYVRHGGSAVEHRTINQEDRDSSPTAAVSILGPFGSPNIACVFWKKP